VPGHASKEDHDTNATMKTLGRANIAPLLTHSNNHSLIHGMENDDSCNTNVI